MAAIHNTTVHPRFDGVARALSAILVDAGLHTDYDMERCSGQCDYCTAVCNAGVEGEAFAFGGEIQRLGMMTGEDYGTDEYLDLMDRLG